MDLHSRWQGAWRLIGAAPEPSLYAKLFAAYREPQRHYHTLQHLEECFAQLDLLGSLAAHPGAVEIALWFHDAIYDPRGRDNEERSARWAKRALASHPQQAERVLVDVDLSILGAALPRFDEYEEQVRQEYAIYSTPVFLERYEEQARANLARALARL